MQASLKVHEEVELAKKGVSVTFSQLLLDGGESVWVSRTAVLVPARHRYGKAAEEGRANKGKPTTLVEDAEAEGCVMAVVVLSFGHERLKDALILFVRSC